MMDRKCQEEASEQLQDTRSLIQAKSLRLDYSVKSGDRFPSFFGGLEVG